MNSQTESFASIWNLWIIRNTLLRFQFLSLSNYKSLVEKYSKELWVSVPVLLVAQKTRGQVITFWIFLPWPTTFCSWLRNLNLCRLLMIIHKSPIFFSQDWSCIMTNSVEGNYHVVHQWWISQEPDKNLPWKVPRFFLLIKAYLTTIGGPWYFW